MNEPAFPTDVQRQGLNGDIKYGKAFPGITIRDYFAAKAMQGMMSSAAVLERGGLNTPEKVTRASYAQADAMLKERNKPSI